MGFDVVEFSVLKLPAGETPLSFAPKLRELCDRAGIAAANYTIGADFLNGSKGDWKAEAERLKDEVRVAKILGAPGMRHDATYGYAPAHKGPRGFDDALPVLAKGCRAVTEFAADLGIRTMIENHGFFAQDSSRVERLMNAVNHPNFGWLVDMGNFLCVDEDPAQALGRAMPYAFHVHAKDFHVKSGRRSRARRRLVPVARRQLPARRRHRPRRGAHRPVPGHHEEGRLRRRAFHRVRGHRGAAQRHRHQPGQPAAVRADARVTAFTTTTNLTSTTHR